MSDQALTGEIWRQLARDMSERRWVRLVIEAEYDVVAWIGGLLVAARGLGDLTEASLARSTYWCGLTAVCVIAAGYGLASGLYRRRYLRGSRDEAEAVVLASPMTTCCLTDAGLTVVRERRTVLEMVLGGGALAVVAMLGARYMAFVAKLRSQPPAATAFKIIILRAADAGKRVLVTGAELWHQLHQFGPAELIMLDRDESALHAVQLQLRRPAPLDSEETVLAESATSTGVRGVFGRFRPEIVFHAMASSICRYWQGAWSRRSRPTSGERLLSFRPQLITVSSRSSISLPTRPRIR